MCVEATPLDVDGPVVESPPATPESSGSANPTHTSRCPEICKHTRTHVGTSTTPESCRCPVSEYGGHRGRGHRQGQSREE